ncbi:MAG TPA: hypothetical protein VHL11_18690, partial [Phototrophicaceae bacterium]|nr:hypothetical protein [Phototrophicaceae bacterium]
MMLIRNLAKAFFLILLIANLTAGVAFAGNSSSAVNAKLGCQKNNPGRPDCSSLEVSGVCEGNVAIFTITNTGKPGEGD